MHSATLLLVFVSGLLMAQAKQQSPNFVNGILDSIRKESEKK